MIKITKFKMGGLWHSEYPLVAKRIITITGRYNLKALRIQRAYSALEAFAPQLDKMEKQELADADSARLSELDQVRDTLFSVILNVAMHFKRTPIEQVNKAAQSVLDLLKKHGHDIPEANYTAETKRLYDLCANFRRQPGMLDTLASLALLPLFEQMETVNAEFDKLFMNRHENLSVKEHIDSRAIRSECDKAVSGLWSAIEYNMTEFGDGEYKDLVNAISKFNAYYKQQLAARATRRNSKKDISGEKPIQPPVE